MRYPLNSIEDVRTILGFCAAKNIPASWSGVCVWIEKGTQFTASQERSLEKTGARFAKKRGQWFWRACDGLPKKIEVAS